MRERLKQFFLRLVLPRFIWVRYRTCWRKVKHYSKARADAEARRLGGGTHAYQCPYCGEWHVGHARW